ncbi:MAG TPA: glycosyltransferase family 2 protein [Bacteroidales bacterium]|nr:glycosyltransferase family 2 protein [Bacteroidales bacterium]HPF02736.1 glycosyltransferase family 2 protein [Bacteroidales bacterium]HPJ59150.1 glycosyltransferase family 2 protein [Bacteroidales bacterium]HPR12762.1 glycosyltransferase family 2 protein [Bacteroidales bacterium]HRW84366.1 glycosyltransferase family 2 protein [Bacteroidales bacterium]
MDLSVIIVSYNVRDFLEQCLLSVYRAAENTDCEIFVVDNNSADGSAAMVATMFPRVKLIVNEKNLGFSSANNQALRIASGRYILLLNPDTIIEEEGLTRCILFMEEHPDAGAAGVRMINGRGRFLPESKRALPTPSTAFFKMTGLSKLFPRSSIFNRYYLGYLDDRSTGNVDIIPGAFMFLGRKAVEKAGLLDEEFFMYGEDIDYSYRIQKAGYRNYYYPEVKIIHFKGESTRKEHLKAVVHFYHAMAIFVKKHFSGSISDGLLFLINAAIFFSAGLALLKRLFILTVSFPARVIAKSPLAFKIRTVVVSDTEVFGSLVSLLTSKGRRNKIAGRISISPDDKTCEVLGHLSQLSEIIRENRIREVVYSGRNLSTSVIIDSMQTISESRVNIRIAPTGEEYLLGSRH